MSEPRWITKAGLVTLHDRSIALHGGAAGIRDEGLLESALERPRNIFNYEGGEDLVRLAAVYAAAISANHPFVDGNKRAAYLVIGLFLEKHGLRLTAPQADAALTILALAAGRLDVDALTAWIKANIASA